jgi:glycosyltransferase involved in cell wall biosynthesis
MQVGIVVPAWNVAAYLGDTLASVLAQTHANWRLVVVDDGSTDGTAEVVKAFADARIDLVRQANAGVSAARNRGLRVLCDTADAVLFLDGDDWLAVDALSQLVTALRAAPTAVAAVGPCAIGGRVRRATSGDVLEPLLWRNRFANPGQVLIRREAAALAGPFLDGLHYGEDWEYLIRLALLGWFVRVAEPEPVLHVRTRPGGARHRFGTDPEAFQACLDVVYSNHALGARFSLMRLAALRARAEAESQWVVGRELIRHGQTAQGRVWLRRSVASQPSTKRLALLAAAHALPVLPTTLHGPFVPYEEP